MTKTREIELCDLLRQAGLTWLISDPKNGAGLLSDVVAAEGEYDARFGTPVDLLAACRARPDDMKAFLQALAEGMSPPMLAMVARILLRGAAVVDIEFSFSSMQSVSLKVAIANLDGSERQEFNSVRIWDAQVLRHLGMMEAGGRPVIDGYYAARMP